MIYYAKIFVSKHTDRAQTRNKLIVYNNMREKNDLMIEKGC